MALTFPAAFLGQNSNAAASATITASSSLPLTPPSRLQDQHTSVRWRTETDTAYLTVALASATIVDTFGLFGLNMTTAGVTRIRASLTDVSAVDGAVYDSGSSAGRVSTYYGNLVGLMPASASLRYVRFDLTEAGVAYLEAGFLMIGLRNQVTINYAPGAGDTPIDPSIKTKSRSMATHIDPRNKSRKWNFNFEAFSETEAQGWVEGIDQVCGASQNIMVIRNCASSNLGRDTLCGLITTGAPTIATNFFIAGSNAYSKTYELETRL